MSRDLERIQQIVPLPAGWRAVWAVAPNDGVDPETAPLADLLAVEQLPAFALLDCLHSQPWPETEEDPSVWSEDRDQRLELVLMFEGSLTLRHWLYDTVPVGLLGPGEEVDESWRRLAITHARMEALAIERRRHEAGADD